MAGPSESGIFGQLFGRRNPPTTPRSPSPLPEGTDTYMAVF
jgi:hypothetical protein